MIEVGVDKVRPPASRKIAGKGQTARIGRVADGECSHDNGGGWSQNVGDLGDPLSEKWLAGFGKCLERWQWRRSKSGKEIIVACGKWHPCWWRV